MSDEDVVPEVLDDEEAKLVEAHRARVLAAARAEYLDRGPGVFDWPGEAYHADPVPGGSARSTMLRTILRAGGPAVVEHERLFPRHSAAFDWGGAAHRLVLGVGDDIDEVPFDSWRKADAKALRRIARENGRRPLLSHQLARARELADVVLAHPVAGPLFRHATDPERTVVWVDDVTGEACRAMVDGMPAESFRGAPTAVDLKTTTEVELDRITRTVLKYGYHAQAAHILDGLATVGLGDADFVLVLVTKTAPYLVRVVRIPHELLAAGRRRNRRALDLWAWCRERNDWPGIPPGIEDLPVSPWQLRDEEDDDAS